jgi:uncharacterized protein (DUF362 family)
MSRKEKVIIRRCPEYDPAVIPRIIEEGLAELGLLPRIQGRITLKPNVVMAHHKVAPSGYTRPEFLDGLLSAIEKFKKGDEKIVLAEKSGAGLPTYRMFRRAGYSRLKKRHRIRLQPIEEAGQKKIALKKGVIHKSISTAREIADNDFLIYAPKLKTNCLSNGLTGAAKLNIGILRDRERMWEHTDKLDEKIVDLLEVGYPDFIATDAIEIAMGGNQFTQHGRHLGIILMATNPVAHDVVGASIFHLDPRSIRHLVIANGRGYGPLELKDIEVSGDISLNEVRERTKDWDPGVIRVEKVRCNMKVLSGEPYCCGGCHGVFLDWLYMIKDRKPKLWTNLPDWTVVIGKYKGNVQAKRLLMIGSCTEVEGRVDASRVRKVKGCPPKHKDLVLKLLLKTGIVNPLFRLDLIFDAYFFLFLTWVRRFLKGRF